MQVPVILSAMIEEVPSGIIGVICDILGFVLNFLFQFAHSLSEPGSLGLSIILMTIFVRLLMLPTGFSSQRSIAMTHRLAPDVEKIKKKYEGRSDTESKNKMNMEIQALYSKSGANPLSGCLPLLITMPIFIALFSLLKNAHVYVDFIGDLYGQIADVLMNASDSGEFFANNIQPLVAAKVPAGMAFFADGADPANREWNHWIMTRLINGLSSTELSTLAAGLPETMKAGMDALLSQKISVETMFGINLINNSGWSWPGVTIPILTALSQLLTSFISMRQQRGGDPQQLQTQRIMMFSMPVMMIFFTVNASVGVGIYWITSSLFAAGQQFALGKYYHKERVEKLFEARSEKLRLKKEKKNERSGIHRG